MDYEVITEGQMCPKCGGGIRNILAAENSVPFMEGRNIVHFCSACSKELRPVPRIGHATVGISRKAVEKFRMRQMLTLVEKTAKKAV